MNAIDDACTFIYVVVDNGDVFVVAAAVMLLFCIRCCLFLSCSIGEDVRITDGILDPYHRGKQLIMLGLVFLFEILICLYPD